MSRQSAKWAKVRQVREGVENDLIRRASGPVYVKTEELPEESVRLGVIKETNMSPSDRLLRRAEELADETKLRKPNRTKRIAATREHREPKGEGINYFEGKERHK